MAAYLAKIISRRIKIIKTEATKPARALPPGPSSRLLGLPLRKQLAQDPVAFAQHLQDEYGDVTYMRIAGEPVYGIFDPAMMRAVLVDHARSFIRVERIVKVIAKMQGQSLLTTEGEVWHRQRKMLQPAFVLSRMGGYARHMVAAASHNLDSFSPDREQVVDFGRQMTLLTIDSIMRVEFSRPAGQLAQEVERAVNLLTRIDMKKMFVPFTLPDWMPNKGEERRCRRILDNLVWSNIRERQEELKRGEPAKDDLLGTLLAWRGEDGQEPPLEDQEVRDQCMTLFLGGHDTTAATLTWWSCCMAKHSEFAERATAEVDRVLGTRLPTYEDVPHLGYLGQTLQETMRLYPPFPLLVTRRATETVQLGSWEIPKGAAVMLSPWVVQRDERWFPNAHQYDPERHTKENLAKRPRGVYMPFGAGPRVCIGNIFGMTQMTLVAAMVLQRFKLCSVTTPRAELHPRFYFTLQPANGMQVRLVRR